MHLDRSLARLGMVIHGMLAWHLAPTDYKGNAYNAGSKEALKAGKPLVSGYCFVIWNIIGDLEFMANTMNLPHWGNLNPCWHCNCEKKRGCQVQVLHSGWSARMGYA